jgi:hypothetical protein
VTTRDNIVRIGLRAKPLPRGVTSGGAKLDKERRVKEVAKDLHLAMASLGRPQEGTADRFGVSRARAREFLDGTAGITLAALEGDPNLAKQVYAMRISALNKELPPAVRAESCLAPMLAAIAKLAEILDDGKIDASERMEAIRSLGKLAYLSQEVLRDVEARIRG